jgi:hypothetical protein
MSSPSGVRPASKRIRGGGSNRPYGIRQLEDEFVMRVGHQGDRMNGQATAATVPELSRSTQDAITLIRAVTSQHTD